MLPSRIFLGPMWQQFFMRKKNSEQFSPKVLSNIRKTCPVYPMISCASGIVPHVWEAQLSVEETGSSTDKEVLFVSSRGGSSFWHCQEASPFHPKDSISWRAHTCSFPAGGECARSREKGIPQINNRAAFEKDAHITRKERDRGHAGWEFRERRRKTKAQAQSKESSGVYKA